MAGLRQLLRENGILLVQAAETRHVDGFGDRGVAEDHGSEGQHERRAEENPQRGARNLQRLRLPRAMRDDNYRPARLSHLPNLTYGRIATKKPLKCGSGRGLSTMSIPIVSYCDLSSYGGDSRLGE